MPNISLRIFRVCLLVLALARCDAQVSPVDRGEALLTVWGSVEIANPQTRGPLVPALAFYASESALLHITEVEVEGEFPSDFTLRVYEPPPKEATFATPKGSKVAFAHITALSPDHPDSLPYAWPGERYNSCFGSVEPSGTGEPSGELTCEINESWCAGIGTNCYEESRVCPTEDSPSEECEIISTSGDPSLRRGKDYWKNFAGLSQEYVVAYLFEPLVEDEPIGRTWGLAGLDTGYYLFRFPMMTKAAVREAEEECIQQAEAIAIQRYNKAHGTDYSRQEVFGPWACLSSENGPIGEQCTQPPPEVSEEIRNIYLQVADDLKCWQGDVPTLIENPEKERISMRITYDVQPPWYLEPDE